MYITCNYNAMIRKKCRTTFSWVQFFEKSCHTVRISSNILEGNFEVFITFVWVAFNGTSFIKLSPYHHSYTSFQPPKLPNPIHLPPCLAY